LELRRGACSHGDGTEEILDLELRIGYSWWDGEAGAGGRVWLRVAWRRGFVSYPDDLC
jgi:hypothetical protein